MTGIMQLKQLLITGFVVLLGLLLIIGNVSASSFGQTAYLVSNQNNAIDAVPIQSLPLEARTTLQLIKAGGPFPFARDGIVFSNRERLLPRRKRGYYHEYTVPTPHVKNRGARRIIEGMPGEYYYTDDHYRSFRQIKE